MSPSLRSTLLLLTFLKLASTQISFSDPISSGTTCIPLATSTGLEVTCTGKGFFIVDPLLSRDDVILFQIKSKTTEIGIGFGQRPDSSCQTSMFPVAGETWATCTPPSDNTLDLPCNRNKCLFDQIVAYTSKDYQSQLGDWETGYLDDLKTYKWDLQPPGCPLADPVKNCWQINLYSKPFHFLICLISLQNRPAQAVQVSLRNITVKTMFVILSGTVTGTILPATLLPLSPFTSSLKAMAPSSSPSSLLLLAL